MKQNTQLLQTPNGMQHVADGPVTTAAIREASPSLLVSEVDSRIVRIRPMSTPVDQISRMVGARPASSMEVEYYSVDTRPSAIALKSLTPIDGLDAASGKHICTLQTSDDRVLAVTDTVLLPDVLINTADSGEQPMVLYVVEALETGGFKVLALNLPVTGQVPAVGSGTKVVRMGRAASELDVQTAQFEALPVKSRNYCQIFKAQIEQSALVRLASKEVGWNFSDQEEVAIMDMRMGMEKSFLFGVKCRLTDPQKYDEVLFTGGIWHQAQSVVETDVAALTEKTLVNIMRQAFTGECAGSTRKILIGGSDLIEALNRLDYTRVVSAADTVTRWGIDFSELRSKFGSLYVIHSEVFDQCGHGADGMIIDPQYLAKYTHVPFKVEHLDLKRSGVRNTDALVATEASCLVLRHPKAHVRIVNVCGD